MSYGICLVKNPLAIVGRLHWTQQIWQPFLFHHAMQWWNSNPCNHQNLSAHAPSFLKFFCCTVHCTSIEGYYGHILAKNPHPLVICLNIGIPWWMVDGWIMYTMLSWAMTTCKISAQEKSCSTMVPLALQCNIMTPCCPLSRNLVYKFISQEQLKMPCCWFIPPSHL